MYCIDYKSVLEQIEKVNNIFLETECSNNNLVNITELLETIKKLDKNLFDLIDEAYKSKSKAELYRNLLNIVNYLEDLPFINSFKKNSKPIALWTNDAEEGKFFNEDYANIANIESVSYMWDILDLIVNKKILLNKLNNDIWQIFNKRLESVFHVASTVFVKAIPSKQLKNIKIFTYGNLGTDVKIESSLACAELPIIYHRLEKEQKKYFEKIKKIKLTFTSTIISEFYNDKIKYKGLELSLEKFMSLNDLQKYKLIIEHFEKKKLTKNERLQLETNSHNL